jgi:hypothetical protein
VTTQHFQRCIALHFITNLHQIVSSHDFLSLISSEPSMDGIEWPPCQDNKLTYVTIDNGKFEVHPGFFDNQCKGYITQGYKMGRVMLKSRMG